MKMEDKSSFDDKKYIISLYVLVNIKKKKTLIVNKSTSYFWKRLDKDVKINVSYQTECGFQYTCSFDNEI